MRQAVDRLWTGRLRRLWADWEWRNRGKTVGRLRTDCEEIGQTWRTVGGLYKLSRLDRLIARL